MQRDNIHYQRPNETSDQWANRLMSLNNGYNPRASAFNNHYESPYKTPWYPGQGALDFGPPARDYAQQQAAGRGGGLYMIGSRFDISPRGNMMNAAQGIPGAYERSGIRCPLCGTMIQSQHALAQHMHYKHY